MDKKIKLLLEDGSEFIGNVFGFLNKTIIGEVVFNTGMVGYPETLTDPSYKGQILVLTYPLIGNYGVPDDKIKNGLKKFFESNNIHITALIISDLALFHNHWEAEKSLSEWLKEYKITGIYGVDTRALTKKIRKKGTMFGLIKNYSNKKEANKSLLFLSREWEKRNFVSEVSSRKILNYKFSGKNQKIKIILLDCGVKNNIIRNFIKRGVSVKRVPFDYNFIQEKYDGLLISNGPGDPKKNIITIKNVAKAMKINKPIFGICLGCQIMALSSGADTYKLKYGHRSQNQPCLDIKTKKCYITSQNHGYAIKNDSIKKNWQIWFKNVNDGSNEGIKHKTKPFFAVQFHPEALPGPLDTEFLFDFFINEIKKNINGK